MFIHKAKLFLPCLLSLAILLPACAGQTTDPRAGGIFSYNPKAYEQRLRERESVIAREKDVTATLEQKQSELETAKTAKTKLLAKQQSQLTQLKKDVDALDSKLATIRPKNSEQIQQLNNLKQQRTNIQSELSDFGSNISSNLDSKKAERLAKLQEEFKRLEREAEALSGL